MKITRLFGDVRRDTTRSSKVLVCSLGSRYQQSVKDDSNVYARHYRNVDLKTLSGIEDLLAAVGKGYDIVHMFCDLAPEGIVTDQGETLLGRELVRKCRENDVKLLWIASENGADIYVKGFGTDVKSVNVVMTLSRNGVRFSAFLDKFLSRVSCGETLPQAWAALVPQAEGPWQQDLPGCIFVAGRPGARLP